MMNRNPLEGLIRSFEDIPVVNKSGYHYFVHPLSDGIRLIDPSLLDDVSTFISGIVPALGEFDLIVTAESMGIPIASAVSLKSGISFSIARKRKYGLPGEVEVKQRTGYSASDLYLNLPQGSGRILILDDVLSTGGTIRALSRGIDSTDWKVEGALILFNKMGDGTKVLSVELGFPIQSLLEVEVAGQTCVVKRSSWKE